MSRSNILKLTAVLFSLFFMASCGKDDKVATLTFKVSDADNAPVSNAKISINKNELITNDAGIATIDLDEGSYAYTVVKEGFGDVSGNIVMNGEARTEEVKLSPSVGTLITGTFELNVKDRTKWYYFSFKDGLVGEGSAEPADGDDAAWKEKTNWDLAFHYYNVRTNSGNSGNGQGGAFKTEFTNMDEVTEAPDVEYITDTDITIYLSSAMPPPPPTTTAGNEVLNKWASFGHGSMTWSIEEKVFVVKTAEGHYAKVKFTNFLDEEDLGGMMKFDYAYQPDGSNAF